MISKPKEKLIPMNKKTAWISVMVIGICGAVSLLGYYRTSHPVLRSCGHQRGLFEGAIRYLPIPRATHCCFAAGAVAELRGLDTAQRMYFNDKGCYAKNFDELTNELVLKPGAGYSINLFSDKTNWSATIAQAPMLPGNYLLTSDGAIYFGQYASATTNDAVLIKPRL